MRPGLDLLDLVILALRVALVAVLYGFLVMVLRTAETSLRQVARQEPSRKLNRTGLRLIVLEPGGSALIAGQVIDAADGAVLGRAERADVVLGDSAVSAEHVRVSRDGRGWAVLDLGSTNGTLVNGVPLSGQTRLQHGDVIALGGVRLRVDVGQG